MCQASHINLCGIGNVRKWALRRDRQNLNLAPPLTICVVKGKSHTDSGPQFPHSSIALS